MAVIALVALAPAITSGLGLAAGGVAAGLVTGALIAAGSYVDSAFVMPAIFGRQTVKGPRIDDLRVTSASEGTPINFIVGTTRVEGTCIFATDLKEKKKKRGGKGGGSSESYSYSATVAIGWGFGPLSIRKVWADTKLIFSTSAGADKRYSALVNHDGSLDQSPDPILEAAALTQVSAYRGYSYTVIQDLQLADWGNRIPSFTAEVSTSDGTTITVKAALERIFQFADWKTEFLDLDRLGFPPPGGDTHYNEFHGMQIKGPTTLAKIIEPIMLAYNLYARETAGKLEFGWRSGDSVLTVDPADLGVTDDDNTVPPRFTVEETSDRDMPSEANVQYLDKGNNYLAGSQSERRNTFLNHSVMDTQMPMVLTNVQARLIARRMLWDPFLTRKKVKMTLPMKYCMLQEHDVFNTTFLGESRKIEVIRIAEGQNNVLELEGHLIEDGLAIGPEIDNPPTPGPDPVPQVPVSLRIEALDIPPLRDDDVMQPGFYLAVGPQEPDATYVGADVYYATGVTTSEAVKVGSAPLMADMGHIVGSIPDADLDALNIREDIEIIEIEFDNEASAAFSESGGQQQGENWMAVQTPGGTNWEIMSFRYAAKTGDRRYKIRGFYRGLRSTRDFAADGASNGRFVMLNSALTFIKIPFGLNGGSVFAVPLFASLDSPQTAGRNGPCPENMTVRPFFVRDIDYASPPLGFPATNGMGIGWRRMSRFVQQEPSMPFSGFYQQPLEEPFERFILEIYTHDRNMLLRREDSVGGTYFDYSKSKQEGDGREVDEGQPQPAAGWVNDPIFVRIRQVGRYYPQGGWEATGYVPASSAP